MEPLRPGDPVRVGEYRLLRRLGAGGMGEVYLGRSPGGRTVAVKLVRGEYAADQEFRSRFRQEVAAARRVGGQWTAPVLDADTESEHPWVATGYVAGPPLGAAVREFGPLPTPVVRALGAGLAETLGHVHASGLVHRDIKPSNVLLALDGPRLIDFGIARALDAATALTQSGFVVGSPGFMSPEQAHGRPAGPPGDVFSLGAVLAYAATGVAPFGEGVSAAVLLYRVLHEPPELGGLDGELRGLIEDCLAKDPADRPTPAELRERLRAGQGGTVRLGSRGWLPPAVSESVGRIAVDLLALDADADEDGGGGTGEGGGAAGAAGPRDGGPVHAATEVDRPAGKDPAATPTASGTALPAGEGTSDAPTGPGGPGNGSEHGSENGSGRGGRAGRGRVGTPVVVVAAVVAAVLATGGLTYWLTNHSGSGAQQAGGASGATTAAPVSPSPSAVAPSSAVPSKPAGPPVAEGAVPAAFIGSWEGHVVPTVGKYEGRELVYRVQLGQGKIGEVVGHGSTYFSDDDVTCGETESLTAATADTLVLSEYVTPSDSGCRADVGLAVTFKLAGDGTLTYTQKDFRPGTLAPVH